MPHFEMKLFISICLSIHCFEETPWAWQLLLKKAFNYKLTYSFSSLVHFHHCRGLVVSRQTWCWRSSLEFYIWIYRHKEERKLLSLVWAFETFKPTSNDILPSISPHLLILVKYCHSSSDQTFKYMHLWGPFLLKSLQYLYGRSEYRLVHF